MNSLLAVLHSNGLHHFTRLKFLLIPAPIEAIKCQARTRGTYTHTYTHTHTHTHTKKKKRERENKVKSIFHIVTLGRNLLRRDRWDGAQDPGRRIS